MNIPLRKSIAHKISLLTKDNGLASLHKSKEKIMEIFFLKKREKLSIFFRSKMIQEIDSL